MPLLGCWWAPHRAVALLLDGQSESPSAQAFLGRLPCAQFAPLPSPLSSRGGGRVPRGVRTAFSMHTCLCRRTLPCWVLLPPDSQDRLIALTPNPAIRNRTRDHLIAAAVYSQMLYQLSYSRPVSVFQQFEICTPTQVGDSKSSHQCLVRSPSYFWLGASCWGATTSITQPLI